MMKRLGSSDSLGALISMCPASDDHSPRSNIYSRDYQSMLDGLDEEGCVEESGHIPEKKRRLSVDQVKALEKNFEVENKLEPDRKVKLASELGLQPRQVAVWFQNRRARWKTKQLERDYGVLKSNFDNLKHNYESLQHDKDALLKEIKQLRAKLNDENTDTESNMCIKEEVLISESDNPNIIKDIEPITPPPSLDGGSDDAAMVKTQFEFGPTDFNSGPSDSDSSAILNEDNISSSPNASNSSYGGVFINNQQHQLLLMSPNSSSLGFNASSSSPPPPPSSINCFNFSDTRSDILGSGTTTHHDQSSNNNNNINVYHPQLVKLEEHNFFSGDETCNIFSDEAAPTLNWYCPDQWNLMLTHQGDN